MKILFENLPHRVEYAKKKSYGMCFDEAVKYAMEFYSLSNMYSTFIMKVLSYGCRRHSQVYIFTESDPIFLENMIQKLPKKILTRCVQNKTVCMNLHRQNLISLVKQRAEMSNRVKQFLEYPINKEELTIDVGQRYIERDTALVRGI
jgi:hypothetical protein